MLYIQNSRDGQIDLLVVELFLQSPPGMVPLQCLLFCRKLIDALRRQFKGHYIQQDYLA